MKLHRGFPFSQAVNILPLDQPELIIKIITCESMQAPRPLINLPVMEIIPELRAKLRESRRLVLVSPPGSGKTTGVPLKLLDEDWLANRRIILLEPRRLAARMAANRMAELLNEEVGRTVGYRIRLEQKVSGGTRIEVVTEGILTRMLQSDPSLSGTGLVIFDEFHERSIHADLALALSLDVANSIREDLGIMLMSATMAAEPVSRLLGDAPVINGQGRSFPVKTVYLPRTTSRSLTNRYNFPETVQLVCAAVKLACREQAGDLLVFLPGAGEIRAVAERLRDFAADRFLLLPLYGNLPKKSQDLALKPANSRRIILATAIAETSLTIEGISVVIDGGWGRHPRFDPNSGLSRLITERVSRAAARQRRGRAGRLGPGICYRLWDEKIHYGLKAFDRPEIMETDLAGLALEVFSWGVSEPGELAWLDPPPAGAFARACQLLKELGILDQQRRLTNTGRTISPLPLHPRLALMLLKGRSRLAADLAALLSEPDIFRTAPHDNGSADLKSRLAALTAFRRNSWGEMRSMGATEQSCRQVDLAARRYKKLLNTSRLTDSADRVGSLLAQAYPDRVAALRPGSRHHYLLSGGRGVRLRKGDPLAGSPLLVAANLDAGSKEGTIYLAARISAAELRTHHPDKIKQTEDLVWNDRDCLVTRQREHYGSIVLKESCGGGKGDPEELKEAFLDRLSQNPSLLPWDKHSRALQARIICLSKWRGDLPWPDLSDDWLKDNLTQWLGPYLDGFKCLRQLSALKLTPALEALLGWDLKKAADHHAPTHLTVPSGSRYPLGYQIDKPPVLAVRLQELFGLAETPRLCSDIPVLLHLLSPAGRPVQITTDLKGFWNSTYQEVRKELMGRYPKHHWPLDPWAAQPTAGTRRRS